MLTFFAVAFGAWFVYAVTVYWLVFWRGPWRTAYNSTIAWVLRRLGMEAITIGARTYLWRLDAVLTVRGRRHEREHYAEQRARPLWWFVAYLWDTAKFGYGRSPEEERARKKEEKPPR